MSSNMPEEEKDAIEPAVAEDGAVQNWPVNDVPLKKRLSERFSVPGALVVCHRRTIFGTWKACETPFHIYNLGMGGLNFWNHGMTLTPGTKMKLTLLIPKAHPIDVVGIIVWTKGMPGSDAGDGAQRYSHITGVKFVDYDAGAWAVLRQIHQMVTADLQGQAPSASARALGHPERSPASETRQAPSHQSGNCDLLEPSEGL